MYAVFTITGAFDWHWWQVLVAALLALDVGGGMVANSLNACKRFYHTPPRSDEPGYVRWAKSHLFFTVLHVHPLVVSLLFGPRNWGYGLFWYAALLLGSALVLRVPLYLRRPASMAVILVALLFNLYVIAPVPGFEWFIPALFVKIVYGHLVREEPYRPVS